MTVYNKPSSRSSRTNQPSNPGRRVRASFARAAVHMEFGRHARALDQADFIDRQPGEFPRPAPEARIR